MRKAIVTCPHCQAEARLGVELDRRMLERFADGVHVYCDGCESYRQMRPQDEPAQKAA